MTCHCGRQQLRHATPADAQTMHDAYRIVLLYSLKTLSCVRSEIRTGRSSICSGGGGGLQQPRPEWIQVCTLKAWKAAAGYRGV
jgi:hypothetical protein